MWSENRSRLGRRARAGVRTAPRSPERPAPPPPAPRAAPSAPRGPAVRLRTPPRPPSAAPAPRRWLPGLGADLPPRDQIDHAEAVADLAAPAAEQQAHRPGFRLHPGAREDRGRRGGLRRPAGAGAFMTVHDFSSSVLARRGGQLPSRRSSPCGTGGVAKDTYAWPRPLVPVDAAVFTLIDGKRPVCWRRRLDRLLRSRRQRRADSDGVSRY